LLKNLVLSGFSDIEIIDLDTIDVSNLNRQFLFRKEHVGHSKAKIARESALKFNPDVKIVAHHANIKSHEFGPDYFKQFTLVMNALDNLDARRHVNRICLSANIPLIESGTAGYLGQVTVIKKDQTECFECQPKPAPKTYPVCTIRSNPTAPIHCIVWAKYLFGRLFGKQGDSNAVTDLDDDKVNEEGTLHDPLAPEEKAKGFPFYVFHKVFHTDILLLASMQDLWKEKRPPKPLLLRDLLDGRNTTTTTTTTTTSSTSRPVLKDQIVWVVEENARRFVQCVGDLQKLRETHGDLEWDKDDPLALDFVTTATNLRASIFGIPLQSRFDVKEKAGNIIPAIATTNAVIAGMIVIEAIKIINDEFSRCHTTYLLKQPSRKRLLLPAQLEQQNPQCYVCSRHFLYLRIDTTITTLGTLVEQVFQAGLGMLEPTVMVESSIIYECGEDAEPHFVERQSRKLLQECRVGHNTVITVDDFLQDLSLQITVMHAAASELDGRPFEIIGNVPVASASSSSTSTSSTTTDDDNDLVEVVAPPPITAPSVVGKKRGADELTQTASKRQKKESDVDIIEL
jgi:ubiquitin-like 1-activating enzyme E1 B